MKRYLWQDRHGRWRVRKDGKTYPLRDEAGVWHEVDTPEGDRLYWEILRGKRAEPKRSWGAAFKLLMETEWDELAPRYRGVMELAWAGCTDDEISSYSGHATIAMVRKYAGEARQIMLAKSAKKKRDGG